MINKSLIITNNVPTAKPGRKPHYHELNIHMHMHYQSTSLLGDSASYQGLLG